MKEYIKKTIDEIEEFILNKLHFKKLMDVENTYEYIKEVITGKMIINGQEHVQKQKQHFQIVYDETPCYDLSQMIKDENEDYNNTEKYETEKTYIGIIYSLKIKGPDSNNYEITDAVLSNIDDIKKLILNQ